MSEYRDLPSAPEEITSTTNPRVKHLVDLRKRSTRDAEGVTLVEGFDEVQLAATAGVGVGVGVQTLYCCPALMRPEGAGRDLVDTLAAAGSEVVFLGRAAFTKASYRESPDGWLAVVGDPTRPLASMRLDDRSLVLVAESVEKPGNLGAMLRTADATGVSAVVAASPVTDWGNPNVVRASLGTVFTVQVASGTSDEVVSWLAGYGVPVVVATPDADVVVTDLDLTGAVAVVVGAEHAGISDVWGSAAAVTARIPMRGRVNSLNVATSAALVLYEAVRQRGSDAELDS